MKIHLVYAGGPNSGLTYSPYSITTCLYNAFVNAGYEVQYYDWCHTGDVQPVGPNDIILGHPNYPANTATRQLFSKTAKCKLKGLIFPFHHAMPGANFPFDDLVQQADVVFSITGKYWYDTIERTQFKHWKSKIVRLDMAVNTDHYPFVKTEYAPPGQRSLYYIGSDVPEKGIPNLAALAAKVAPMKVYCYGNICNSTLLNLPNVIYRGYTPTPPEWAKNLAATADIFVNVSVSDANPTTILEAASWGFPVACNKESGYYDDGLSPQIVYNLNGSVSDWAAKIDMLNRTPSHYLLKTAIKVREIIESEHNWDKFAKTVVDTVRERTQ